MIDKYEWTRHARVKMQYYGLSEQRVKRIIRHPARTEEGILEGAIGVMQPSSVKTTEGKPSWKQEIWAMYVLAKKRKEPDKKVIRVITAWRYPGVSSRRDPIPEGVLREVRGLL